MGTNLYQSGWLGILLIIQNPRRIRRNYNYKSCSKLHVLSPQIFWEFCSPCSYFPQGEFSFRHLNSIVNYLGATPPVRDFLFRSGPPVGGSTAPVQAATSVTTQEPRRCAVFHCWSLPPWRRDAIRRSWWAARGLSSLFGHTGRDTKTSHHRRRSDRHPRHHIPGATELLVAGHFFLTIVPFVYPELIPDVPESAAAECCRCLPNTYISEPPPSFLPRRCATHRAASCCRHASALRGPRMSAPSAPAAAVRPPWATWIHTSTVSPGYRDIVLLGHVLKSAHWPLIFFSIFLNIFESLQVQNFV
jgi:hypothetical protein